MKWTLTLVFSLLLYPLIAQRVWVHGKVALDQNDTVSCIIGYKEWLTNPKIIEVKITSSSKNLIQLTPNDALFIQVGTDEYISAVVTMDMRPIEYDVTIWPIQMDTFLTERVFLRVIAKGKKYSLYEYLSKKRHYFIQKDENGPIVELRRIIYPTNTDYKNPGGYYVIPYMVWNKFRDQLEALAFESDAADELYNQIANARYTEKDLKNIVVALNDDNDVNTGSSTGRNYKSIKWHIGLGTSICALRPSKDIYYEKINPTVKQSRSIVAGFDVPLNKRDLNPLTFRIELAYSIFQYKNVSSIAITGSRELYTYYDLKQRTISPSMSFLYHFLRGGKLNAYIGPGFTLNLSNYDTTIQNPSAKQNNLQLIHRWESLHLRGGVKAFGWEVAISMKLLGDFIENNSFKSASFFLIKRIN